MVQIPSPQPKNPTRKGWIFLLCQYFKFSVVEGYEDDERGSLGIEPDRCLWRKKGRRRVVQRSSKVCGSNPLVLVKTQKRSYRFYFCMSVFICETMSFKYSVIHFIKE